MQNTALSRRVVPLIEAESIRVRFLADSEGAKKMLACETESCKGDFEKVLTFCVQREQQSSEIANRITIHGGNL